MGLEGELARKYGMERDGTNIPNFTESFKLDGTEVTATAAEINAIAGGGLSAGELGVLDGATAGTGVASKALVLSAAKTVTISAAPTSATPGTVRTVIGELVPTPATTITSGTLVGVRGHLSFPTSKTITGGAYLTGTQGKLSIAGTMNHADSRLCAVLAQLDTTGATLTAGQLSGLWVDMGAGVTGAGGDQFNMIRITNTVNGSKPNAIIYAHSNATYLLDLSAPAGTMDWLVAAGTSSGSFGNADGVATKVLVLNIGGTPYYVPCHTANG